MWNTGVPPNTVERRQVAFQERLLALGGVGPVHRLARERQPHGEQEDLRAHPGQIDPQVREVDLALRAGLMGLRHERLLQPLARRGPDLRPALRDVVPHRRVRQLGELVLIDQPRQDPPGGVTLLARRGQVLASASRRSTLRRIQLRRRPHRGLALRRDRVSSACRTVRRCTPYLSARARTDNCSTRYRDVSPRTTPPSTSPPPPPERRQQHGEPSGWGQIRPSQQPRRVAGGAKSGRHTRPTHQPGGAASDRPGGARSGCQSHRQGFYQDQVVRRQGLEPRTR